MHKLTSTLWLFPGPAAIHHTGSDAVTAVLFETLIAGDCNGVSSLCPHPIQSTILRHSWHSTPTAEGRHLKLNKRYQESLQSTLELMMKR